MARPQFIDLQYRFAAHLRNPEHHAGPADVEERRLQVYRDLFYKNVEGFMANAFPVLRRLFDDRRWHAMVRDYYNRHQAHTPMFPRMPQEFLQYLANERDDAGDPPFLYELAHYEWLEADVGLDTRELDDVAVDRSVDLLSGCPVANPVLRAQAYAFPVHRISPDYQPCEPPGQTTYLVVFRRRNDEIAFMELNPVSARLLNLVLDNDGRSSRSLLEQIATELQHPDPQVILAGGQSILETFLDKQILLGTVAARR